MPGTRALSRALDIVQAFDDRHPRWTLSTLAAELDLKKSTVHRILSALEERGFLRRVSGSREYCLGPELIALGARALKAVDVRDLARGELESLARGTGYDLTLECLVGWKVLLLHEERGHSILGLESPVGTLWPAHATSTGKVLLAFRNEPLEEPPGGLAAITDHTIVSWIEFTDTLDDVRKKGFATSIEELEYGYAAVGAPVRDRAGHPAVAISIGGPIHRMGKERIPELAEIIKSAAFHISERLGYRSEHEDETTGGV